jgi:type III secretion system YscI/HrpB-like protein
VSSIGESILSGLRSVSDDTRARYRQIAEVLSDPAPSISDLMSLQFVILQNSLQFELTSKLISKAPQTIDSIVKTQ